MIRILYRYREEHLLQLQKTAQFTPIASSDWTVLQNYSTTATAIQSKTNTAVAQFGVQGGWFRLLGSKSPSTGIFEVWIDGVKSATIDTYYDLTE